MQIRPYKPGDEQGIFILDRAVELHPWNRRNDSNWYWKYQGKNPAGQSLIYVAENNGEIIAHFAALPIWYWIEGKKVLVSHSIGMIVLPEWQNKGLIKFVADQLLEEVEKQRIPFTYGYPNDNAYDLHIKLLGYEDATMQRLFHKEIKNIKNDNTSETVFEGLNWQKIERFDDSVDFLWNKVKNDFQVIVIRNSAFLNWRYIDRPDAPYYAFGAFDGDILEGYCVLKIYQDENLLRGHFIDLFTQSGNSNCGRFLVENGLQFFNNEKVDEVTLWMQGSPFFEDILKEYNFCVGGVSGGGWPGTTRPMICRFNIEQEKYKSLLNEKNWYFTMGDTQEIY